MPSDSIVVDFLGLPGVGKSELSQRVGCLLRERNLAVRQPSYDCAHGIGTLRRRLRKSVHVARELTRHPCASTRAARRIAGTRQGSKATMLKLVFNWLLVTALVRQARRIPGVHLFDQGITQAAWSVALDGSEETFALFDTLPTELGLPDLVVVVAAELTTVANRLLARRGGASRLDQRQEPGLLQRGARLLDQVSSALCDRGASDGGVRILEVANETPADLERRARELAQAIEARAGMAAGQGVQLKPSSCP